MNNGSGAPVQETAVVLVLVRCPNLRMRFSLFSLVLTAFVGLLLVGACSSPPTLRTQSLSQAPSVDGTLSEWDGGLTRLGDRSVSMSAAPTDSLLYLAVVISDQSLVRSVAEKGLVVWVDPTGKQQHTYGVQYPIALRAQRAAQKTADAPAPGASGRSATLEQLFPSDLAVIRNDTIRHRMPSRLSSALQARATLNTGSLIYEIAIPVNPTAATSSTDGWKHGLRTPLGRAIAIGLETPESGDESGIQDRPGGIPSVTGQGRRGRSRRGRRGRRQRRQNNPSPDRPTLNLWTNVVSSPSP